MKKIMFMAAGLMMFNLANAQKPGSVDAPAAVKDAFAKKYPGIKVEKWEKEGADYEAEFELNNVESSAVFAANGTFKEVEQEIKVSALPEMVMAYCSKNYVGYKIHEAEKITEASGTVMYEAEMKKGKEHFDALFDDKGVFVKKGEVSTKEEEKD